MLASCSIFSNKLLTFFALDALKEAHKHSWKINADKIPLCYLKKQIINISFSDWKKHANIHTYKQRRIFSSYRYT